MRWAHNLGMQRHKSFPIFHLLGDFTYRPRWPCLWTGTSGAKPMKPGAPADALSEATTGSRMLIFLAFLLWMTDKLNKFTSKTILSMRITKGNQWLSRSIFPSFCSNPPSVWCPLRMFHTEGLMMSLEGMLTGPGKAGFCSHQTMMCLQK